MRKVLALRTLSAALIVVAMPGVSFAQNAPPPENEMAVQAVPRAAGTVVDVAAANAAFSSLATALKAANLTGPLAGTGPFTVFAPTNDAFAKLPPGTLDALVKAEGRTVLARLLSYHVVAGRVSAADLVEQIRAGSGTASLTTLAGPALTATLDGDTVVLTDAKGGKARVIVTDVDASNGVIHALDTVVMP